MKWRSLEESIPDARIRSLHETLAERKGMIAKYVPAETEAIHGQAIAELKSRKIAAGILRVGETIPEFQLPDQDGKIAASSELIATGPLVLCFIRGRWCPFCVAQMEAMNLFLPQIEECGGSIAAISPQTVQQAFFMRDQHKLRFRLLSDSGNRMARQFGLVYAVSSEQKNLYRRTFVNLPHINGDDTWELPIPATYVIDRHAAVLYASAAEDYTQRPEPEEILQFLEAQLKS